MLTQNDATKCAFSKGPLGIQAKLKAEACGIEAKMLAEATGIEAKMLAEANG